MKTLIEQWFALPQNKRMQLSTQYGFRDYGVTDEQLAFDLENKLPVGLLVVEEVKEVVEVPEKAKIEPVKAVKPKKVSKAKKKK